MEQSNRDHRILQTTGQIPEPVKKLYESLETLLKSKYRGLVELFSKDEIESILRITLELNREGLVPEWSLTLSAFGCDLPTTSLVIALFPAEAGVRAEILKQTAEKGLRLLSEVQEARSKSKTESK
ncbi:MAG: hypothetical protein Q8R55_04660 [Candidatus Taylorbacteria bacterium]|nr:hypothetical protein [Candidatus Taylorbacteria bacterium]